MITNKKLENLYMRVEFANYLSDLINKSLKNEIWKNSQNYFGSFEQWLDNFIESFSFNNLRDTQKVIGEFLYDKFEAFKAYKLSALINKIDTESVDEDFESYYNNPKWPQMINEAKELYKIISANYRKYFIAYLGDFLNYHNAFELQKTIYLVSEETFYDNEEVNSISLVTEKFNQIYKDLDDNFKAFNTHPKWPELVEIVKTTLKIFESNNQKHGFEQTIQEIELAAKKQEQFEVRQKAAELLWKKFVNWHKYRRQRRMFSRN